MASTVTNFDRKFIVHVSLEIVVLGTMGYFFYNKSKLLEDRLKKLEDQMNETQGSLKVLLNNTTKSDPENHLEKQLQRLELEKKVQKAQQDLFQQQFLARQQHEKQQVLAKQQHLEQQQRLEQQQVLAKQQRLEQQQRIEDQKQKVAGVSQVNQLNKLDQEDQEKFCQDNNVDNDNVDNDNVDNDNVDNNYQYQETDLIDLTQFDTNNNSNNHFDTNNNRAIIEVIDSEEEELDREIENELNELNTDIFI